jgi:hypothetical protein
MERHNFFESCSAASDKIHRHGYHRFYDTFLSGLRNNSPRVLEIGVEDAKSIELWQQYFVNPELTVIDILDKPVPEGVRFIRCDQSSTTELTGLTRHFDSPFDFIIDDGSHVPHHQLLTLRILWDSLAPGGIYIVEDIETSYWGKSSLFGYDFDSSRQSIIRELTPFIDVVNWEYSSIDSVNEPSILSEIARDTEMISFGANCVVLVKKNVDLYGEYYDRQYGLAHKVNERSIYHRVKRKFTTKARGI